MESNDAEEENTPLNPSNITLKSTESFQKFIYELFDKNGILNNLRAFLRGHIVEVLKSAETGKTLVFILHLNLISNLYPFLYSI